MICAWIDTSRDATGSSQTSASGRIASARATATRWRWPPENWCGNRSAAAASSPTAASQRPTSPFASPLVISPCVIGPSAMMSPTRIARVERCKRVLKHHLDARRVLPAGGHHGLAGKLGGTHACLENAGRHAPQRGFAAARLADQPECFALRDAQRYIFDRMHDGRGRFRSSQSFGQPLGERRHRREPACDTGQT